MRIKGKPRYRVYAHVRDGVVFYIGSGRGERPLARHPRSSAWHEYVGAGDFDVRILGEYTDRSEAIAHEACLIREFWGSIVNRRRIFTLEKVKSAIESRRAA